MAVRESHFSIPITILLAEANSSYREITRKMLKFYDANFIVDTCGSVDECVSKARSRAYDLILADENVVYSGELDLFEALDRENINVPVLVFFEEGHEEKAIHAMHSGAADYIFKTRGYLTSLPFTVKRFLEKRRAGAAEPARREAPAGKSEQPDLGRGGYFILNHRGKFLSANPGMETLTGYTEEELQELSLLDLLPREREWALFEWLQNVEQKGAKDAFSTEIRAKYDKIVHVIIKLTPVRGEADRIISYRGEMDEVQPRLATRRKSDEREALLKMVDGIWHLMRDSRLEPMPVLLQKLAHLSCQLFRFQRATIALLDRSRRSYLKVAMIGYAVPDAADRRRLEVPKDVIDRIFSDRYRIKVLYYSQDKSQKPNMKTPVIPDRRSEDRRPHEKWHPRDVVLVHLADADLQSFGYISLDTPANGFTPDRKFFHELEMFSRLASMLVENQAHSLKQEQHSRRLTQVLVTSNIFKLYYRMQDLLREAVWSVKFSLGFRLALLILFSQKSGRAEIRAVACDDRLKAQHLQNLTMSLQEFLSLLDPTEKKGKSYLIFRRKQALQQIKEIYYDGEHPRRSGQEWPVNAAILVPLKSRQNKMIGAILADDPEDMERPEREQIRMLEILANQISVAIENRLMYSEARRRAATETATEFTSASSPESEAPAANNRGRDELLANTADESFWLKAFPRLKKYF